TYTDAGLRKLLDLGVGWQSETGRPLPRGVDAERKLEPGLRLPPEAEVEQLPQSSVRVRELALVDEQPRIGATGSDLVEDPVERELANARLAEREPQDEVRGRQPAR